MDEREQYLGPRPKKPSSKWCGRKEGREHMWGEWVDLYPRLTGKWKLWLRRCEKCGKKDWRNQTIIRKV